MIELTCFFGLLGLAYLVVLEGSGFFNLAIGPYAMMGALSVSGLVINQGLTLWLALVIGLVVVLLLAGSTELLVVRPIERRSGGAEFPALVAVAALVFGISQGAGLVFGRLPLPGQQVVSFPAIDLAGAFVSASLVLIVGFAIVAFGGLTLLARTTAFGRALRAAGDNREAARILGLRVDRIRLLAFIVSGGIACGAGIAFASKGGVSYDVGLHWALLGFLALVIGGTGSWLAPLLGGFILSITQVIVPFFIGGEFADYAVLLFALIFFGFRPQGLYVRKVRT